jgi:hypothetical protein
MSSTDLSQADKVKAEASLADVHPADMPPAETAEESGEGNLVVAATQTRNCVTLAHGSGASGPSVMRMTSPNEIKCAGRASR